MTKVRDRERLVDAAAKVFSEKGLEAARLADIAAELGVLKGSLYYHVSGKGELLFLVVRRIILPMIERLECIAASRAAPREKLAEALREHVRHFDEFYRESRVLFVERALPHLHEQHRAEILALYHRYADLLHSVLEEGVAAGELRWDLDLKVVALGLLGMCNWVQRWYRKDGRLPIEAIGETFVRMALEGLQPRQAPDGHGPGRPLT